MMRDKIYSVFKGNVFQHALFYNYGGGLRFSLSEGGSYIQQFLTAMQKATLICHDLLEGDDSVVCCVRVKAEKTPFAHRRLMRELKMLRVVIPVYRCLWLEPVDSDDWVNEGEPEQWLTLSFELSKDMLQSVLWAAFAKDFGFIQPRLLADFYIISLSQKIAIFPYDDRGMDVVGDNQVKLLYLYQKYNDYLLPYDLDAMRQTFAVSVAMSSHKAETRKSVE